jgi:hypothetical protein
MYFQNKVLVFLNRQNTILDVGRSMLDVRRSFLKLVVGSNGPIFRQVAGLTPNPLAVENLTT